LDVSEPFAFDDWLGGTKMTGQQAPVAKFKAGSVSAALWENQIQVRGTTIKMLKVTVQRRFKDKDGFWKNSTSFGRTEVPLVIFCLERAFEKMLAQEGSESETGEMTTEEESVI
jgi:hypothetical protein